jgi:hypothetical protein
MIPLLITSSCLRGVLEGGHGPYKIRHVTWCTRFDTGKKEEGEKMVVARADGWYVPCQKVHGFPIPLRESRDLDEAKGCSIHGDLINQNF